MEHTRWCLSRLSDDHALSNHRRSVKEARGDPLRMEDKPCKVSWPIPRVENLKSLMAQRRNLECEFPRPR